MKLLLDTCVWGGAKAELQVAGHDVFWTGDLAQDPGDEDILAQAHQEQQCSSRWIRTLANWRSAEGCHTAESCVSSTSACASKAWFACRYSRNMGMN
jgi:hypothetical protein